MHDDHAASDIGKSFPFKFPSMFQECDISQVYEDYNKNAF